MAKGVNRFIFFLAILSLSVALTGAVWQVGDRGRWVTLASMPSARQEISTAALNGKIFVIAGFNSSGASTNTVEVYDPTGNSWSSAAPLPIATNHNAAAVAVGKLYAFGGTSNRVFVYDPQSNFWSDVAPMRFLHGGTPAVGVINDRIYVAGGTGGGMVGNEVEVYDPVANTWTTLAPMNVPRNHTAGGVIDGKFYVVGGRGSADSATALEVYDPQTNIWSMLAPMPTGRSGVGAGVVNGELYVFGGELPRLFGEVEVYNPRTNTWQQLPPMQTPRHGIFAAVIGNIIYLPGGATQQGFGATNVNEAFVVSLPPAGALQFSSPTYSVDENGGSATITVTRTGGSFGEVKVNYAASNGSATAGLDYTPQSGTITFVDGDTNSKTFTVPIIDDLLIEGNETVILSLSNPTGNAALGPQSTAELTIIDNDSDVTAPTVTISRPISGSFLNSRTILVSGAAVDDPNGTGVVSVLVNGAEAAFNSATGEYNATITATADGAVTIRVRAIDRAGNISDAVRVVVTVDTVGPNIIFVMPAGGILFDCTPNTVAVEATDSGSGVDPASVLINDIAASSGAGGQFTVKLSGLKVGPFTLTAVASDRAGNRATVTNAAVVRARGNLTGSQFIGVQDLILIIQMIQGIAPASPGADINCDGKVDIEDLIRIIQIISGAG